MFLVETVLVVSTFCTVPRRKLSSREIYYVTDGNPCQNNFQIITGESMEETLISEFQDIDGVQNANVHRDQNGFYVEIELSVFDRPTRNKVFEKQLEMYKEFPSTAFEFCVVDASSKGSEDAHAA
jgi:hypothetical protein